MPLNRDGPEIARITTACHPWRQGDLAMKEIWFAHACDPSNPLTSAAEGGEGCGTEIVESATEGLMVVTQTCDIRRHCIDRPYVEVCPLVKVDVTKLDEIERLMRPSFASLKVLSELNLVADLDRVMTVEKAVLATWNRTQGCQDEEESKRLAAALARKRSRFAFPNEFREFVEKLRDRIKEKHSKASPEGKALRGLAEIRVSAEPSWTHIPATTMFWFIRRDDDTVLTGDDAADMLRRWLDLMPATASFKRPIGQFIRLSEMTAPEYLASERLDLDHLSQT